MADPVAHGLELGPAVALLASAVVAVTVFRKVGLGSVLGYLAAGLAIGPFGFGLFQQPETILHVAELGVVIFLFIIGLEMKPDRLWRLRKHIFGLGAAQVLTCGLLLTLIATLLGVPPIVAFIAAMGFVLSSTAVIMQMLQDRNEMQEPQGQRAVAILLFEDLLIVPLLAIVAVLAAMLGTTTEQGPPIWQTVLLALGALAVVFVAGRYVLNPVFRFLANYGGREVMLAAALLVVAGAAWIMDAGGLSMAMGAFMAGVLLSDSSFRHQLEADLEPFRSILLGLFFVSVGMSLNLSVVTSEWQIVAAGVALFMVVKSAGIYGIARLLKSTHHEALERAALFAQGGEFAFVLYGAALGVGLIAPDQSAIMSAIVILSMVLTPLVTIGVTRFLLNDEPVDVDGIDGVDKAENLRERVLVIGFGRFAQVVSQSLLARDVDVSIIDMDVEMIQAAERFGFKVYYGDGTRLDVLRASGAEKAETIIVAVDKPEAADKIVELVKSEFPLTKLFVRAFDRGHSLRLIKAGVEYHIRETFESAMVFAEQTLMDLGFSADEASETVADVRRRDAERLDLQVASDDITAGRGLMRGNLRTTVPAPYVKPKQEGEILNEDEMEAVENERVVGEATPV